MIEFREYDESDETIENTIRKMTPEERDEILKEHRLMSEKERDEIIKRAHEECEFKHVEMKESSDKLLEEGVLHKVLDSRSYGKIGTYNQFREFRARNPCYNEREDVDREVREIKGYFRMIRDKRTGNLLKNLTRKEFADHYEIPESSVNDWKGEKVRPSGLRVLENLDKDRVQENRKLTPEARNRRIDSTRVYETLREFKDPEKKTVDSIAGALERLDKNTDENLVVYHAKLKLYSERGPRWLKDVGTYIEKNRTAIENSLNQLLHKQGGTVRTRLGMLDGVLYVRTHNQGIENWANTYASDHFHFRSAEFKNRIVQDARRRLNSLGDRNLSRLMAQLVNSPERQVKRDERIELRKDRSYLSGATFDFILDVTGRRLRDMESEISHLCGRGSKRGKGRIKNPRFPKNVEQIRAQMLGAMMSDGHLRPKMTAKYYEKDIGRLNRFKEIIAQFGEVQFCEIPRKDGTVLDFPVVLGRLLNKWGVPVGDKSVLNCGLPSDFHKSDSRIIAEYLKQMVSEDGTFLVSSKRARVQWERSVVLDDDKFNRYGIKTRIDSDTKSILTSIGTKKRRDYTNLYSNKDATVIEISWKDLVDLEKSKSADIGSKVKLLWQCILDNPSRLLDDEKELAGKLGIKTIRFPVKITYYQKTGRVSVNWRGVTSTKIDGIRWALIAPPDHPRKKAVANRAIKMFSKEVRSVLDELG